MTIRRIAATIRQAFTASLNRAQARARRAQLTRDTQAHNESLARGGHYTAALYLTRVLGVGKRFARKYAGAFGRAAAKAHRELFGAQPAQNGLTVIGNHPRFTQIATYGPDAYAALEKATRAHKSTAALLAA